MAIRLISRKEKFSEDEEIKIKKKNKTKDEFGDEEEEEIENDIELEYVTQYHVDVDTEETSIAKTYENKNEMTVTLKIPKSDYNNESFKKLLNWASLPVQDEDYYRDLAVNMMVAGNNEKTVLFSHARITMNVKQNTLLLRCIQKTADEIK